MLGRPMAALVSCALAVTACSRTEPAASTPPRGSSALVIPPRDATLLDAIADAIAPDAPPRPPLKNATCPPRARARDPGPRSTSADVKDECVKHAECTSRAHGRCVYQPPHQVSTFGQSRLIVGHNECVYDQCLDDDECRRTSDYEPRDEQICICGADRNQCTFANCRTDSDCPSPYPCGGWRYCHSAADQCRTVADCKAPNDECAYSWDVRHYVCRVQQHIAPD